MTGIGVFTVSQGSLKRKWDCRLEFVGVGYVLSVGVSLSPSVRIIVLGVSLHAGKIIPKPKTKTIECNIPITLPDIATTPDTT